MYTHLNWFCSAVGIFDISTVITLLTHVHSALIKNLLPEIKNVSLFLFNPKYSLILIILNLQYVLPHMCTRNDIPLSFVYNGDSEYGYDSIVYHQVVGFPFGTNCTLLKESIGYWCRFSEYKLHLVWPKCLKSEGLYEHVKHQISFISR